MRQDGIPVGPGKFKKSGKTADFCPGPESPGYVRGQSPIPEKSSMFLKSSERSKCGDQCAKEKDKVRIMRQFKLNISSNFEVIL